MIVSIEGDAGTSKSTFMFTGPLPLVAFAFDAGSVRALYGARSYLFKGIDIKIRQYPPMADMMDIGATRQFWKRNGGYAITVYMMPAPVQLSTKNHGYVDLINNFTGLFNAAKDDPEIATIGVDTMTICRRHYNDAHLEMIQRSEPSRVQLIEIEYGKPNDKLRSIYHDFQNISEVAMFGTRQKHLIVTHHMTEKRVDSVDSRGAKVSKVVTDLQGNPVMEMEGLRNTVRFVDVALEAKHAMLDGLVDVTKKVPGVRYSYVKCGFDLSKRGQELENPIWDTLVMDLNKNLQPPLLLEPRGDIPFAAPEAEANGQEQ